MDRASHFSVTLQGAESKVRTSDGSPTHDSRARPNAVRIDHRFGGIGYKRRRRFLALGALLRQSATTAATVRADQIIGGPCRSRWPGSSFAPLIGTHHKVTDWFFGFDSIRHRLADSDPSSEESPCRSRLPRPVQMFARQRWLSRSSQRRAPMDRSADAFVSQSRPHATSTIPRSSW